MPMRSLIEQGHFTSEITTVLTAAFDNAWAKFKSSGSPLAEESCAAATRALLAKRIIETAQSGERDVQRLVDDGTTYLGQLK